ncbi:hypothetical protein [Mesorhizobium sp. BHbdii]
MNSAVRIAVWHRSKLELHGEFLILRTAEMPDIPMPALAAELAALEIHIDPSNLSRWFIRNGYHLKNVWPTPSQAGCAASSDQSAPTYPVLGLHPGQDGDSRAPILIKRAASSAIFLIRFSGRRSTVRPSTLTTRKHQKSKTPGLLIRQIRL